MHTPSALYFTGLFFHAHYGFGQVTWPPNDLELFQSDVKPHVRQAGRLRYQYETDS